MLDLAKLAQQMPQVGQEMQKEAHFSSQRLLLAEEFLKKLETRQEEFMEVYGRFRDRLIFSPATPIEPISKVIDIPSAPPRHTVFSSDGSQIAPSHHEIAYCYLINIGRIMLHYGQNLHPLLDSIPEIYYKSADLNRYRQWGVRTEEWMGYQRTVAEGEALANMACTWVNPPGAHFDTPNLAMSDGSLVYWFLENLPHEAREEILTPIINAWEKLRESKIPWVGYLSASRAMDANSFLRLVACPYEQPDCYTYCDNDMEKYPCQKFQPLRDATLWATLLQPGQRSALFRSNSRILELYPDDLRPYFCYLHGGVEIARVEFPQWVAQDDEILRRALGITLAQIEKGFGYPVALAEAHNLAVVKGGDRSRFFALLERQMLKSGLRNVGTSYKEARKRGSIA
ncbi:MAG: DNA double-strand break repair nuclease NurA [Cyanobacterium sp. T60_A2020_053]|nr:DNA double-strand break repair nuclease NurA [Cyanobacterium sp. T60_A2020_053]